jgi:hypothetical protein
MANEFALNLQDASLNPVPFALPNAAAGTVTSAVIDLGVDVFKPKEVELDLAIPALSTVIAPDTKTFALIIETSTTANFAAIANTIANKVLTGAGGAGIPAQSVRSRLPSNCERYVRGKVVSGANTTDASALNAALTARF